MQNSEVAKALERVYGWDAKDTDRAIERVAAQQPKQKFRISTAPNRKGRFNTSLACEVAKCYEAIFDIPFPGGIENACIIRSYAGHHQRSEGAISWEIGSVDSDTHGHPQSFGSHVKATEAVKDWSCFSWEATNDRGFWRNGNIIDFSDEEIAELQTKFGDRVRTRE